jgi:hypothetical protein
MMNDTSLSDAERTLDQLDQLSSLDETARPQQIQMLNRALRLVIESLQQGAEHLE